MRILVTGGTGFVGSWIVKSLEERGVEVVVCTRKTQRAGGSKFLTADLLRPAAVEEMLAQTKPDIVLHAAWCVDHGKFWNTPANLDWVTATLRLLQAAKRHGVRRFVGVGTCFEYAWPTESDCKEATTPIQPTSLYAVTKDATRRMIEEYSAGNQLECAWGRLFYLFGPNEHPDRLASSVAIKLARNEPAPLSSGRAIRDFMDVRDAGAALAALAVSSVVGAVNIGSGEALRIVDLARALQRAAGGAGQLNVGVLPDRANEPPRIVADVGRLHSEVGYHPSVSVRERLVETYFWWQQHFVNDMARSQDLSARL
ncbi:NAD-dependent epimerase/dehydratase family protein [Labrys okinawensis]|uniref:NAD-dependent epimerase/dehydratase family protein n=1 Tax=Labrys okinawensis TaxID=346911 RepID=UPI0039BD4B2D